MTESSFRAFLKLVQQQEATAFMGLFAAFQVLILRWTGQEDFLVASPVSGRDSLETEELIGFFVNMLALRARPVPGLGFRKLLAQVRPEVVEAFAHQDAPFTKVVEMMRPDRSPGSSLFQVLFTLEQDREGVAAFSGMGIRKLGERVAAAKLDLSVTVSRERGDFWIDYRADLFDRPTMQRLADRFQTLLEAVAVAPDTPLTALDLLAEAERHQLVTEWNDVATGYPRELAVHEIFAAQAARRPDAVAVIWRERTLTFGELDRRSGQLAGCLRALGVGPEVAVALCMERSPEVVIGLLGILKAGGFYVPLDPSYPEQRLAGMLEDSGARVVLTDERMAGVLPDTGVKRFRMDGSWGGGEGALPVPSSGGSGGTAYVMYTSGSTGRPKGVQVPHLAIVRLVRQQAYARLGEEEVFLQAAPISFDASTLEIWGPLLNGGRLALYEEDQISLEGLERAIRRHGVTILWLTAGLFHEVVEARVEILQGVRQLLAGGDVLLPPSVEKLLREIPGVRLINGYGPTESTTFTCCHAVQEAPPMGTSVPIGRPIGGTRVEVLDRGFRPVPIGVLGELCIGGDGLATGYLNRPDLTAERFVPDPLTDLPGERLYRTGDLVRWLATGLVEFAGRIDSQVKLRGYRVEPGEIEAALIRHPAVREAAVVVREERSGDRRLVAFLVPVAEVQSSEAEILDSLRQTLPVYMVPTILAWVEELPRNPNGKVDRLALASLRIEPARPAEERGLPRTATQAVLAEIWAEVLGLENVGLHASFFDLGGHSLLAMQVISRARRVFGVEVSMRTLFEHDTVVSLAEQIDQIRRDEAGLWLPPIMPALRMGPIPLSFAQQRLWFLDQLTPGGTAYNVPAAWDLTGQPRIGALAAALSEIVRRHEALRTTFHPSADGAFQAVAPPAPVPLPVADLSGLTPADRETEAGRLVAAEAGRPFDLIRGPLLRAALLRLENGRSMGLLTLHHIVSDGWSLGVLGHELSTLEAAFAAGNPSPLPELPVQYADFALWQRQVLSEGRLTAEVEYWREQLRGAPAITDLPLDRPRPLDWAYAGRSRSRRLSAELSAAVRALGRHHGCTLFMTLLVGFQVLLARYASQPDLSVGTPVAGRGHLEVEGLIGFFVNTLVLRLRMDDDPPFENLLQRVRGITLEAHAHQDVPFEELVEKLVTERNVGISPLFQVMFAVQNNRGWRSGLAGLEAREASFENRTAKFDLSLGVQESAGGIDLALEYSTRLFDDTTAVRLLASLERLLKAAVTRPDLPWPALPLLSPAERQQMVAEWNDTEWGSGWAGAVHEQIAARAVRTPEAPAVVQGTAVLSYRDLDAGAERLAACLRRLGVGTEDVVAVCVERSPEMIIGILGVLKAGATYLPVDPSYPQERLALLLSDAPVKALLTQERLADRLPWGHWPVLSLDRPLPAPPAGEERDDLPASVWPEQAAYLIYTSGSTGRPKAVVGLHGSLASYVRAAVQEYGVSSRDRVLQFSSISFDASLEEIFPALVSGATLVLRDEEWTASAALFLARCGSEAITLASLPTAYWHELARACGEGEASLPASLRLMICGGERALPERVGQWCRAQGGAASLMNTYGPTEATIVSTGCVLSAPDWSWGPVPIGRPWRGVRAHVVTRDLELVPPGAGGELVIGGNGLTRGYLGRPEITAERFVPDPFTAAPGSRLYRTGDRVRRLADGSLDFLGRIDQQVKVRGYRIELGEIETVLSEYPLVRDVVVVAREDVPGHPRLVAYVVPQPDSSPTPEELRAFLQEVLPEFMVPAAFVALATLPLTVTGKLDRRALPAPDTERSLSSAPFVAPRTPTEEVLALVWTELLQVHRIGIHDNFFELGGHSLLATQVVSRVRNVLQVEVPVRAVFERPTLAGLAREVDSARRSRGTPQIPPLVRVDRGLDLPLSFAQQRLWFIDQLEPQSTLYNMPMWLTARGRLAVDGLGQSLREILRRHEVLRTVFRAADGQPFQVVTPEIDLAVPVVDLSGLKEGDRRRQAARLMQENARRPFTLDRGPLMRLRLLRLAEDDHLVLFDMHHIASDGWSLSVLIREVGALYNAFSKGLPSPLRELPVQYADYAVWQRQWLQGEALEDRLRFWKDALAGLQPLELPTDRPRPASLQHPVAAVFRRLPEELGAQLARVAREERVTPFMMLLAAFQAIVGRYSGQEDLAVGTAVAGRTWQEIESLIGLFVNLIVLRGDLAGNPTFRELLGRVRQRTLLAYAHQDLPFERLVELLDPEREAGRPPLFQVLFSFHREWGEARRAPGSPRSAGPDARAPGRRRGNGPVRSRPRRHRGERRAHRRLPL